MTTLKDNRKYQAMTVADADELFLKIARIKAILDRKSAAHKKRLADLEIAHKEDVASELSEYELLTGELADYIQAILDEEAICVLGNEALLKKEKELFNTLEPLFQS